MFTSVVMAFVPQTTSFQMSGTIEQQEGGSLKLKKVPKGRTEIENLNWHTRITAISSPCAGHGWVFSIVVVCVVLSIQLCLTLADSMDKVLPFVSVSEYTISVHHWLVVVVAVLGHAYMYTDNFKKLFILR